MILSGQRGLSWFRRQSAIQGLPEGLVCIKPRQNLTYPLREPGFLSGPKLTLLGRLSQRREQRE
jgi:hypothetical protein